jgi:hypothetical protein
MVAPPKPAATFAAFIPGRRRRRLAHRRAGVKLEPSLSSKTATLAPAASRRGPRHLLWTRPAPALQTRPALRRRGTPHRPAPSTQRRPCWLSGTEPCLLVARASTTSARRARPLLPPETGRHSCAGAPIGQAFFPPQPHHGAAPAPFAKPEAFASPAACHLPESGEPSALWRSHSLTPVSLHATHSRRPTAWCLPPARGRSGVGAPWRGPPCATTAGVRGGAGPNRWYSSLRPMRQSVRVACIGLGRRRRAAPARRRSHQDTTTAAAPRAGARTTPRPAPPIRHPFPAARRPRARPAPLLPGAPRAG